MQLFANNADSELDGAITSVATSITLKTGGGAKFPTPTGGDFFLMTMFQKVGAAELNHEIVKCTARSGDVLTVVRAQEGTTGFAFSNADPVELRETAGTLASVATLTAVQTLTNKTLTGYTETVYALSGTVIDPANGTVQTKTLSANTTFTESIADGQSVILGITAGAYSVTWPSTTWAKVGGSGVAPTLTSTGVNWVVLWQVGGVLRGSFLGTA